MNLSTNYQCDARSSPPAEENVEFHLQQTAVGANKNVRLLKASGAREWSDMIVTLNMERPHSIFYGGFPYVWISMPLNPASIMQLVDGVEHRGALSPYRVSLIPPRTPVEVALENSLRSIHVYLKESVITEVAEEIYGDAPQDVVFRTVFGELNGSLSCLLRSIEQMLLSDDPMNRPAAAYLARALAAEVLSKYAHVHSLGTLPPRPERLQAAQLRRVVEFVNENLHTEISLNDLAAVAGLSRTNFIRRFKGSLNDTPHRFVNRTRMRRARQFLTETNSPISAIAAACGFSSQAHLSTAFKKELGICPSHFRETRS